MMHIGSTADIDVSVVEEHDYEDERLVVAVKSASPTTILLPHQAQGLAALLNAAAQVIASVPHRR
jgi:hypothetical protein